MVVVCPVERGRRALRHEAEIVVDEVDTTKRIEVGSRDPCDSAIIEDA